MAEDAVWANRSAATCLCLWPRCMSPPASTDFPALFFKRQGISRVVKQKLSTDSQNDLAAVPADREGAR